MVLGLRAGVEGGSCLSETLGGKSSSGVASRLGGGELKPVFNNGGESLPGRRLVSRLSDSDTTDAQLTAEGERLREDGDRSGWGIGSARMGTGERPWPRFVPRIVPPGLGLSPKADAAPAPE